VAPSEHAGAGRIRALDAVRGFALAGVPADTRAGAL
jgi:uncharacterized membrane protein YeiB